MVRPTTFSGGGGGDHISSHLRGGSDADLAQLRQDLIRSGQHLSIIDFGTWTDSTSGSGSVDNKHRRAHAFTGTTSSSTALIRSDNAPGYSAGKIHNVLNWSKALLVRIVFANVGTTNGIGRITLGKDTGDGVGALSRKGIGIQIEDQALKGIAHDGNTLDTVDLSTTLTDNEIYIVDVVSDGEGNIEWFVDGTSQGTSTGGPTGDSGDSEVAFQFESENNDDSANQVTRGKQLDIYVEQ